MVDSLKFLCSTHYLENMFRFFSNWWSEECQRLCKGIVTWFLFTPRAIIPLIWWESTTRNMPCPMVLPFWRNKVLSYISSFQAHQCIQFFYFNTVLSLKRSQEKPPKISGQITIIPKPEVRGFWGDSLTKPPFGVTSAEVAIICPKNMSGIGTERHFRTSKCS